MDKNTKILIPEIPVEWTARTREGDKNTWNIGIQGLPRVSLMPPEKGLYAERFEDGWYWVSGCAKCNGEDKGWSYNVCDKHDVCTSCGIHRSALTEIPWGHRDGWICKPCEKTRHERAKQEALEKARENDHSESDCSYTDEIICPCCASVVSNDDIHDSQKEMQCDVCDAIFDLQVDYSVSYTTKLSKPKERK